MIGLPLEDYHDLDGIIDIIHRLKRLCKGRHNLKISLSSYVPKPHTPFQWATQLSKEELMRRQDYIRDKLPKKGIEFSWHDLNLSFLEAVFAKGDRRLAQVVLKAYELGCRFDGWNEYFKIDKWQEAFVRTNIDPTFYANRAQAFEEILPWEHIDTGITKDFLWQEYQKALNGQETPDCKQTQKCNQCGLEKECFSQNTEHRTQNHDTSSSFPIPDSQFPITKIRVRIKFTKTGEIKYISHLDLLRLLIRAIRRAKIPIAMTEGYSPHPSISFSPALAVGISSQAEYADIDLYRPLKLEELSSNLNKVLPAEIKVLQSGFVATKPSLTSFINRLLYKIELKDEVKLKVEDWLAQEEIWIFRVAKRINIRNFIDQITLNKQELLVLFKVENGQTVKMPEFLEAMLIEKQNVVNITRLGQFYKDNDGNLVSPL